MVIFLNTLIFIIAYLLDTASAFDFISVFGVMPDFVFITLVCFCIFYGKERGLVLAIATGLITDMVTASTFGAHAIMFLATAVVCAVTYETIFEKNLWTALVTVFVLSFAYNTVTHIFGVFMGGEYSYFHSLWRYILPRCLFNVIITPLLYKIVGKVYYKNERIF